MTRSHISQDHIKELEPVFDEYGAWFMNVARRVFYPSLTTGKTFTSPQTFTDWLYEAEKGEFIDSNTLFSIRMLHEDLTSLSEKLINETLKTQKAPDYDAFDKLATFFEEFINSLRRIEKDYAVGDIDIDIVTGLRSSGMFYKDIRREMDRLARQGKPFCVALARIDGYEKIKQALSKEKMDESMKALAGIVRKSLRSFDDAYRTEEDEFILSLKQTSPNGGLKALNRIKKALEEAPLLLDIKDGPKRLSISSCIAEPLPEDDIRTLLANMKKDMDGAASDPGTIIEYFEMSPLQRFLKEGRE